MNDTPTSKEPTSGVGEEDFSAARVSLTAGASDLATPGNGGGPAREWRCFHCAEVFTDFDCAAEHFGKYEDCQPACKIGAAKFREMENELAMWRSESDPASKEFYGLGASHGVALRREEERGYARGLADGRAEHGDAGSRDHTGGFGNGSSAQEPEAANVRGDKS